MKRLVIALALLITPSVSKADMFSGMTVEEVMKTKGWQCAAVSKLAEGIMTARQQGRTMSQVMQGFADEFPEAYDFVRPFVISAYEEFEVQSTDDKRKEAINTFREVLEIECYKQEEKYSEKNNPSPTD